MLGKLIEYFQKPPRFLVLIFIIGILIGWLAIGWWIWPVNYIDAGYSDLRADLRYQAMENVINAYAQTNNNEKTISTYLAFGETAADTFAEVKNGGTVDAGVMSSFEALLASQGHLPDVTSSVDTETEAAAEETVSDDTTADTAVETETDAATTDDTDAQPVEENRALNTIGTFLGVLFGLFILVGIAAIYIFIVPKSAKDSLKSMFSRSKEDEFEETEPPAFISSLDQNNEPSFGVDDEPEVTSFSYEPSQTPTASTSQEPRKSPIERTVNYVHNDLGRSNLDQSFSLKDSSGRTELEYGIQMSDYVEIAGVTYALAFDVYLASHPENRTITRVLVNRELLKHPEVLQRYEGKGEPIAIDEYYTFQLETGKYRLNGTILVANYVYDEKYGGNYLREMETDLLIHYL